MGAAATHEQRRGFGRSSPRGFVRASPPAAGSPLDPALSLRFIGDASIAGGAADDSPPHAASASRSAHAPADADADVPRPLSLPTSSLALGGLILNLPARSPGFQRCGALLRRQPPFRSGGLQLSVLRVFQCARHLPSPPADIAPLLRSHRLAFVCGDLGALGTFVRAGLRLTGEGGELHPATLPPEVAASLVVTDTLGAAELWGGGVDPAARGASLCVWRVVLAVRRPVVGTGGGGGDQPAPSSPGDALRGATPCFIIDYAVEARAAQLQPQLARVVARPPAST